MNNFEKAYNKLILYERGYVNDPDDTGGETYNGISRNNHPNWKGWLKIDAAKKLSGFPANLEADSNLQILVKDFYKKNYWDVFFCDILPYGIAEELFEIAVNTGVQKAASILQSALNILNKNRKLYENIKVDGLLGPATLAALKTALTKVPHTLIYNVLNILQGAFYVELMQKKEVYEKYIGWFNRIEIKR